MTTLVTSLHGRRAASLLVRELEVGLLVVVTAVLAAYALTAGHAPLALGIAILPLLVWESTRLTAALVVLGASLPEVWNLARGTISVNVALSDLLLVFIGGSILPRAVAAGAAPPPGAPRPAAVPRLRRLTPCLVILVPGLFLTASRGAVAATVIGLAVVVLMHESRGRVVVTRVIPVLIAATAAFVLVPAAVSQRLTTTSAGNQLTTAQYSIHIHQQYLHDAHAIIALHRWTGIGVGNYLAGDPYVGTQTSDPHEVVLLQEAEGGYGFAASFVLLLAATSLVLYRMPRVAA